MSGALHGVLASLAGAAKDAFFKYVTLLLPGNGTNGAQNNTFLDGSTNNITVTRNGNPTQGTFSPYGANWSWYFDGVSTSVQAPANAAFNLGSGAFTIEMFVCRTGPGAGDRFLVDQGNGGQYLLRWRAGTALQFLIQGGGASFEYTWSFPIGVWFHIAVVRSGNVFTMYLDGVSVGTMTNSASIGTSTDTVGIGSQWDGVGDHYEGLISNLRIVKGTALYTANFTPPSAPLSAVTNTSLLACKDNRFIDGSANNFTLTRFGSPRIQRFNPFAPAGEYLAANDGGSANFDGSGDYLSVAHNTALELGSSDFTIEFWLYDTGSSADTAYATKVSSAPSNGWQIFGEGTPNSQHRFNVMSAGAQLFTLTGNLTARPHAWTHVAVTRSGSSWNLWVNGVSAASTTSSAAIPSNTDALLVGGNAVRSVLGSIANFRIVKGTAVYTSAFTPPTAPLTAITNTSLLLNFTNAGIIDNARMGNLETVGNAQISTAQSKFGGSSILFDGTGDYLRSSLATSAFSFGTGNFTVEYWIYYTAFQNNRTVIDSRTNTNSTTGYADYYTSAGKFVLYLNNSNIYTSTATVAINTWNHIAVCRTGTGANQTLVFINGAQDGSFTLANNITDTGLIIGNNLSLTADFAGYIDDLRITKGVARYTANFTPSSVSHPLM